MKNWFKKKEIKDKTPKIKDFPMEIEHWAAGNAINSKNTCEKDDVCPLFPYWDENGKYIDHDIGEYVPLFKCNYHTAIYKIVGWRKNGSDNAEWDDGRHYKLEFKELFWGKLDKRIVELNIESSHA